MKIKYFIILSLLLIVSSNNEVTLSRICIANMIICNSIFNNCHNIYSDNFIADNVNEYRKCAVQIEQCIEIMKRDNCI